MASTLGKNNPFRYRGYYYDAETGYYYLNARYYNPEWCRFISADPILDTSTAFGCNLFNYCGNDPINRIDSSGQFWDTFFDIVSFVSSVVEVCVNPTDPWVWAGLAGDAVDLIPFVSGLGEATRAVKTVDRIADAADDIHDASKVAKKIPTPSSGKGFDNFKQLKKEIGSPGEGKEWHHIVEQCQINKSGFSSNMIQNANNIIAIDKKTHRAISGYYSSIQDFSNNMTVRSWLAGQSFEVQYNFGLYVIGKFN